MEAGRTMKLKRVGAAAAGAGLLAALTGCFPDGVWKIGNGPGEVKPGVYATGVLPTAGCGVAVNVADTSDGLPHTIDGNSFPAGRSIYEVPRVLHGQLVSVHCGIWGEASPTSYNPKRTAATVGVYRVPVDLEPGTYTAPAGKGCLWFVYTSLSYVDGSMRLAGQAAPGHTATVTIKATDRAFYTFDCGGWTRTGP
jgi:hypothetical protein